MMMMMIIIILIKMNPCLRQTRHGPLNYWGREGGGGGGGGGVGGRWRGRGGA